MSLPFRLSTIFIAGYQLASIRARRLIMGTGLFLISAIVVSVAIIAGLASIFFGLADLDHLVAPSLITAGLALLVAIAISLEAKHVIKKP